MKVSPWRYRTTFAARPLGLGVEHPENLVLVLSKDAAVRLVTAKDENDRQAALLDGRFFFNGEPFLLYLSDKAAQEAASKLDKGESTSAASSSKVFAGSAGAARSARPSAPATAVRDTSPEALAKMQAADQKLIDVVAHEFDAQAHFVSYAPPAMVGFRKAVYLEFSVDTTLASSVSGSRYKMAALAFDEHIAHLVRPMMTYFKGDLDFDGIAFSTTIHQAAEKSESKQAGEAVESFFRRSLCGATKLMTARDSN
ncbi:MAG TPA: hypothetical protein VMI10_15385 [Terriglobales bacterium]|nr:hypothetical protein [Terriglobales bacterium]